MSGDKLEMRLRSLEPSTPLSAANLLIDLKLVSSGSEQKSTDWCWRDPGSSWWWLGCASWCVAPRSAGSWWSPRHRGRLPARPEEEKNKGIESTAVYYTHRHVVEATVDVFPHQIDGTLEETGGVQDLVHDGGLELVGVELLSLKRHSVIQDHR